MGAMVRDHPAAGVVGRRDDRDGRAGDVDAEVEALGVDGREVAADEVGVLVADVQVHAVRAQPLHLVVDGAGNDVTGRELGALVEARHEPAAVRQEQTPALAAHRLGDQERLDVRVVEARRVELHELHVRDATARAPGHGDPVAGRDVGVARVEVHLARAAGGQHHEAGRHGADPAGGDVEQVGADAALGPAAARRGGDEVYGDVVLEQRRVRPGAQLVDEGVLDLEPGGVGGVDDPAMAVPALARQVVGRPRLVRGAGEVRSLLLQPADVAGPALHHQPDHRLDAQPGACLEGVVDVGLD